MVKRYKTNNRNSYLPSDPHWNNRRDYCELRLTMAAKRPRQLAMHRRFNQVTKCGLLETNRPWFMSLRVCGANKIPENILNLKKEKLLSFLEPTEAFIFCEVSDECKYF